MSMKTAYRKNEFLISIIAIIVGAFSLVIGLFGTLLSGYSPGFLDILTDPIGPWSWWLLLMGIILLVVFVLVIYVRIQRLREFRDLFETESKSKFRKNIARIEELAIKLGPSFEEKVIEKEEDLNIK